MKSVASPVSTALKESYVMYATPKLVAEFNMNLYVDTTVTNTPDESTKSTIDSECFPLDTIVKFPRPGKGIIVGRVDEAAVSQAGGTIFRVASKDNKYKYWQPAAISNGSGNISGVSPRVLYASNVLVSKIVIGIENTWASPTAFTVSVSTNGTTYSTVATNPAIDNEGRVTLYWTGSAWSTSKPASINYTTIRGIGLDVTALGAGKDKDGNTTTYQVKNTATDGYTTKSTNGFNSHFSLIEMAGIREVDFTSKLVSMNDSFEISDASRLFPVGRLSSNKADIELWNGDGELNSTVPGAPYYGILDKNVKMTGSYVYQVGGTNYPVQQFEMYADEWDAEGGDSVSVTLYDYSKFLQENNPPPMIIENQPVTEIVRQICAAVGFNKVIIEPGDYTDFIIPIWYANGEKSVWEELDAIAAAHQCAIYFDGFGYMKIATRSAAFNVTGPVDYTLSAVKNGNTLPNIVSMSKSTNDDPNIVKVNYKGTEWSPDNNGQPTLQTVWEAEENATLRSSPLVSSMTAGSAFINIGQSEAEIWPYSGKATIEGEIMSYDGKQYKYYTGLADSTMQIAVVKSQEEMEKLYKLAPNEVKHKCGFTGALMNVVRGQNNTVAVAHDVDTAQYNVRVKTGANSVAESNASVFIHNTAKSSVTFTNSPSATLGNHYTYATIGAEGDSGFTHYGTKFKMDGPGSTTKSLGMIIHNNGTNENGYYIELLDTLQIDGKVRKTRNEVIVYSMKGGKATRVGGLGGKAPVTPGYELELDVYVENPASTTSHVINVWINGSFIMKATVPQAQLNAQTGKFGIFLRGKTKATFDYLYATQTSAGKTFADDFSTLDKIRGGFYGGALSEWVYSLVPNTDRKQNVLFVDEFGPFVHEYREFDVKFEPAPVMHSRMFNTNTWNTALLDYVSTPFGGKFTIVNTGRIHGILAGEDTLSIPGTDSSITQMCLVLGRTIEFDDTNEKVERRNEPRIKLRGESEAAIESDWIQSKEAAEAIAEWVVAHWSLPDANYSVTIFGNTLIEAGDIVTVNYPLYGVNNIKCIVLSTNTKFEQGISTELTMRRVS